MVRRRRKKRKQRRMEREEVQEKRELERRKERLEKRALEGAMDKRMFLHLDRDENFHREYVVYNF
jgi:hypothetical protein